VPETVTDDLSEAQSPELRHRVGLEVEDGSAGALTPASAASPLHRH
jgi:hypothetical protein